MDCFFVLLEGLLPATTLQAKGEDSAWRMKCIMMLATRQYPLGSFALPPPCHHHNLCFRQRKLPDSLQKKWLILNWLSRNREIRGIFCQHEEKLCKDHNTNLAFCSCIHCCLSWFVTWDATTIWVAKLHCNFSEMLVAKVCIHLSIALT
jgi:hypothetical protein